jgi:hypothetical protein
MFGIEIIEVGIGLVFTYLTISTICSGFVEAGVKVFSYRATHLKQAVGKLLGDASYSKVVNRLYNHHLINGGTMNRLKATEKIQAVDFASALVDCFAEASPKSEKFVAIRQAILDMEDAKLKKGMLQMLDESMEDVTEFKAKVGKWFDKGMDEATEWYRRKMRSLVTAIAFVVVGVMNADTLSLATTFWNDNDLRAATVTASQEYIQNKSAAAIIDPRVTYAPVGVDSVGNPVLTPAQVEGQKRLDALTLAEIQADIEKQIQTANALPIGWERERGRFEEAKANNADLALYIILKIIGLFLTIGAINLGAPYWFQQLRSLMSLRFGMHGGQQPAANTSGSNSTVTVVVQSSNGAEAAPVKTVDFAPAVFAPADETPDTNMV